MLSCPGHLAPGVQRPALALYEWAPSALPQAQLRENERFRVFSGHGFRHFSPKNAQLSFLFVQND